MPGTPVPPTSPWVVRFADYQDNAITISVDFNETTHALLSGTIVRDQNCLFATILVGVGADGIPDDTLKQFRVPTGTNTFTAKQMSRQGFDTLEDFTDSQITAGR